MKSSDRGCRGRGRPGEHGGSRLNLIIVLALIGVVVYVGYQYVPVAYNASLYKVYMQDTIDKAVATGKDTAWAEKQLRDGGEDYGVPQDAVFKVEYRNQRMEANAHWTRPIPLPFYIYKYEFDHTVRSSAFLTPR
jgi:hypothetical protein